MREFDDEDGYQRLLDQDEASFTAIRHELYPDDPDEDLGVYNNLLRALKNNP